MFHTYRLTHSNIVMGDDLFVVPLITILRTRTWSYRRRRSVVVAYRQAHVIMRKGRPSLLDAGRALCLLLICLFSWNGRSSWNFGFLIKQGKPLAVTRISGVLIVLDYMAYLGQGR